MRTLNFIPLPGCSPTPLAAYLKGLGIFRLISEQADPSARGFWENESFVLHTKLTKEQLADFFLEHYAPTPLLDPWNSGSGFLQNDKAAGILKQFAQSPSPRLSTYQTGIKAARDLCDALSKAKQTEVAIKAEAKALRDKTKKEALKNDPAYKARLSDAKKKIDWLKKMFIPECRLKWRGPHLECLESAIILDHDLSPRYLSLLGTGYNDGNLDFTDNFRQRFLDLFDITHSIALPRENTAALLNHALYGIPVRGTGSHSIGQYMPGAAGGANSSNGLSGKPNVNPWDFILFMEGTVLFSAATSRRLGTTDISSASAPFAIRANAAGHASASLKEKSTRGEQWFPLWERPATLREIRALLSEGRAQLGRTDAREPVDMARAIARLGVARGISAFERYGYIERNGQSNFAVPLGRWKVVSQPHQDLLMDIDGLRRRISRDAADERATASLTMVARRLNDAILAVTADGASPTHWQTVLIALSEVDTLAATLPPDRNKFGMVPRLRTDWLAASNDDSPEFRLAVAFASQTRIRRYFLPLDKLGRLDKESSANVVCHGRDFITDAIAFLDRRFIEASKDGSRSIEQYAHIFASLADIASFLQGKTDTRRILSLIRALMAIDYKSKETLPLSPLPADEPPDDAFVLFRFCLSPRHWKTTIPARADIFHRLASNDLVGALRLASSHLRTHGFIPPLTLAVGDARIFAAALAFPLSIRSRQILSRSFISTINNP